MTQFLRNPRQAATIFDLGGAKAPRPKGLFYVAFNKTGGIGTWNKSLSYVVKDVTQPSIQPKVEELTQYNRKKQIYTGYTTTPINLVLYDTADATVLQMWDEYTRYYFNDFSRSETDYAVSNLRVLEDSNQLTGFGYNMHSGTSSENFFQSIDIYQVFRNTFNKTTLINPRISSFDPEAFDYQEYGPLTYKISITYEGVIYANKNVPQNLSSDDKLSQVFSDEFNGNELDSLPGPAPSNVAGSGDYTTGQIGALPNNITGTNFLTGVVQPITPPVNKSGAGGVLGVFGNFNFGSVPSSVGNLSSRNGVLSAMAQASLGNGQIAAILGQPSAQTSGINSAFADVAAATIGGNPSASLTGGVMAAAQLSNTGIGLQIQSGTNGINLSQAATAITNSQLSPTAQIGVNAATSGDDEDG